jgi:hypothetical protein
MVEKKRWIGLAEVRRLPGNDFFGRPAAFVPVIGDAVNIEDFFRLVCEELCRLRFEVERLQDVDLLEERKKIHVLPVDLERAIARIGPDHRVACGTFHTFPE